MNQHLLTFADDPPPLARRTDPATSQEAAEQTLPKLGYLHRLFLDVLAYYATPMTAREVERAAANESRNTFIPDSVRKRAAELERRGLIAAVGVRECGVTGSKATIYQASTKGIDNANERKQAGEFGTQP